MYVSDRQMVEEVLPAQLMLSVVLNGASDPQEPDTQRCILLLRAAEYDPVLHLDEKKREKILRRAERTYHESARAWSGEGQSVGKFGLIVYYWLRAMMDAGFISFPEEGPFQQAMDLLLPALEPHAEIEAVDRSAQKQSRKFHAVLQGLGYYQGVELNG